MTAAPIPERTGPSQFFGLNAESSVLDLLHLWVELFDRLRVHTNSPVFRLGLVCLRDHELNTVPLSGIIQILLQERVQNDITAGVGAEHNPGSVRAGMLEQTQNTGTL